MRRVASGLLLLFVVAAGPASGEEGMASIYGSEAGSRRADGHHFVPSQIGCAHRTRISVGRLAPQLTVPTYPGTRLAAPSRQCQVLADRLGDAIPVVFVELAAHASDQAEALREARPD